LALAAEVGSVAADQVLAGDVAGPAGVVAFGTYGAVGRAACQSASELPSSLRATIAAMPPTATTMANRFSQRLLGFRAGSSAAAAAAATTALPRSVASTTRGAAAAAASASASLGSTSSCILLLAASTAGGTLSSASSKTGPNFSTASCATWALRCLADLAYGPTVSPTCWAYGPTLSPTTPAASWAYGLTESTACCAYGATRSLACWA
jgi:hypothetical protein